MTFCECCGFPVGLCECYRPLTDEEEAAGIAYYERLADDGPSEYATVTSWAVDEARSLDD